MKESKFCFNIKKIIKKKGYKLGTFAPLYLDMSSQTFGHQLKNDNLKVNTIELVLDILEVTFEEVRNGFNLVNTNTDIKETIQESSAVKLSPRSIQAKRAREVREAQSINKNTSSSSILNSLI